MIPRRSFPARGGLGALAAFVLIAASNTGGGNAAPGLRFAVSFPSALSPETLDGRLLLLLSTDDSREPRFQISDGPSTQLVFGVDVEAFAPGNPAFIAGTPFCDPL